MRMCMYRGIVIGINLSLEIKTLLTRGRAAATGYSSLLVCLFVHEDSAHLAAIALRLQHG